MSVVVVDYGSGNLHSAVKALERASREGGTGADVVLTADPEVVRRADRIVLPGVGAFADCKRGLDAVPGMVEALDEAVHRRARPFLGICVGSTAARPASTGSPARSPRSRRMTRS